VAAAWSNLSSRSRTIATALIVCLGCQLGAATGNALRFPHTGTAILYPPYAIVTVALLLSDPRRWWMYLVAGSVGTFLPHVLSGDSPSFVLLTEIANYARALVAAWGVRQFGERRRLDTLRGMTVFLLFAVVLAPAIGAFIGASVVALHYGVASYWMAWKPWLLSNVLTGLTLLPIILIARARFQPNGAGIVLGRWREAFALALGLSAVAAIVFLQRDATGPAAYVPLPLLLWAAVRFGPGGTSAGILIVALAAIAGSLGDRGPFVTHAPQDGLLELQLFLFAVSIPLLLLSALLQEQRRTADELRASRERYRAVVEDQTELICRFGPDGNLTFVNGAFGRAMGRPADELIGTFFWAFVPPEKRDAQAALSAGLRPENPMLTWEQRLTTPAGATQWEHWRVRAMFDRANRLLDYQAVGRDITERKRAEEEHALLESQRAHAEALREADRRKDEFLAMLAHELRNPLAPIAMAVELLRQAPAADEQIGSAREIIGRQTAQLARLVDDLLDVARITSGTIQLRTETVDLARILASTLEISRPVILARQLDVDAELDPGPLLVRGDAVRLAQLFSNLVNNAAKYSEVGGRIHVTVVREGSEIVLRFKDNGLGIPGDMLERIFEPFTQVQRPRDAALGGLGLGLALVKKLVELHGGTVRAQSDGPGQGSEFVVWLPAVEVPADALGIPEARKRKPISGAIAQDQASRLQILVVDDVVDAAETLARVLRLHGDVVYVANDGRAALDVAARISPAVVFVDLQMPGMDGLEVARRLRAGPGSGALLVAVTDFGQLEDRRQTAQAGFDHHLTKPLDVAVVQALLAARRRNETMRSAAE